MIDTIPTEILVSALVIVTGGIAAIVRWRRGQLGDAGLETQLRDLIVQETDVVPATEEISEETIRTAVTDALPDDDPSWMTLDGSYFAPQPEDVDALRDLSSAPQWLPYRSERYDCEDFAFSYQALAALLGGVNTVGVVIDWSDAHAYNVIVDSAGEVRFYEPQSDMPVVIGSDGYEADDVTVVF